MITKKDTNEQYHSSEGISASGLKSIWLTSVFDFNRQVYENKPSYRIGTIIHEMILEPDEFKKNYMIIDQKIDRRKKEGKELFQKYQEKAEGKELITFDESQILLGVKQTLESNTHMSKIAREYLEGEAEISHYFEVNGVKARVRPDMKGKGFISDIKTAQFQNGRFGKREFNGQVRSFGYHIQAAFYSDMLGYDPQDFKFIWIEKKYPFRIIVTTLNEDQINDGRYAYKIALDEWKFYLETGVEPRFREELLPDGTLEL